MNLLLFTDFLSFIKIQHWVAVKHSHHIILNDLYEEMSDKIDEFVECSLGLLSPDRVEVEPNPIDAEMDLELHLKIMKRYNDFFASCQSIAEGYSSLESLLDDMTNIVSKACYLLKMK